MTKDYDIVCQHALMLGFIKTAHPLVFLVRPVFITIWTEHFLCAGRFIYPKEIISLYLKYLITNQKVWMICVFASTVYIRNRN